MKEEVEKTIKIVLNNWKICYLCITLSHSSNAILMDKACVEKQVFSLRGGWTQRRLNWTRQRWDGDEYEKKHFSKKLRKIPDFSEIEKERLCEKRKVQVKKDSQELIFDWWIANR